MTERDEQRLQGVHPDLVRVVCAAVGNSDVDFIVTEGLRTLARQKELLAKGASRTLKSRHLTGHAVDLAVVIGGEVRWDWPLYMKLANSMRLAAITENVPIVWGGTWKLLNTGKPPFTLHKSFPDGPHFELLSSTYP